MQSVELFHDWRGGDGAARDKLFAIFYKDLSQAAAAMLRNERTVSLSAGDLVHEVVIKLIQLRQIDWVDRAHFLALAARFMRRVLIDHVRAKRTDKREHCKVELTTRFEEHRRFDLGKLDHALLRLAAVDAEIAEIVEMRYFGGMTTGDVADVLGCSEPTVKRRWAAARVWLLDAMSEPM